MCYAIRWFKCKLKPPKNPDEIIDKISNFVEQVRIKTSGGWKRLSPTPDRIQKSCNVQLQQQIPPAEPGTSGASEGCAVADKIVINAEQFKAKLQPPKGESYVDFAKVVKALTDDDDEFFHVTCHIESGLKSKIARGDFIDLEQLLSKEKTMSYDESKVELVSKGGHTFFKPIRETQINGLRKWEQAFRVYAAIYTDANPERSGEIWQYMHTINVAASSFHWDNVANYDVTFRQLMAFKPHRSWAKI